MKPKSKKSQGLSLNVIIVAALALIVLVVLVAIFTGRIGGFGKGASEVEKGVLESCEARCKVVGYSKFESFTEDICAEKNGKVVFGKFTDVGTTWTDEVCCCLP